MLKSLVLNGFTIFLTFAFFLFIQVQPLNNTVKFLNLFNIIIVVVFFIFQNRFFKNLAHEKVFILVLVLTATYIFSAKSIASKLDSSVTSEPIDKGYVSDEKDFLKTFYIMKKEENYYKSFGLALRNDARFTKIPTDLYSWRLPTVFYIWRFLATNGQGIINLFIILSSISLLAAFLITKNLVKEEFAVFSLLALIPYFLNAVSNTSFLFIEWWSLFLFLLALAFIFNKKTSIGIFFLVLSSLTRELLIIPAIAISIILSFRHKKITPLLIVVFAFLIFMFMHFFLIEKNYNNVISYSSRKIHPFDKDFLLHILAFSTQFYRLAWLRIGTLFTTLTLIGFLITLPLYKNKDNMNLLLIAISSSLPLFLISLFISTSDSSGFYSDYWAIIIIPVFIIFSPLIFNVIPFLKKVNLKTGNIKN